MIATSTQIKAMIHYFFEKSVVKIARLRTMCVVQRKKRSGRPLHKKMESN
jgi:ribosomal protein L23